MAKTIKKTEDEPIKKVVLQDNAMVIKEENKSSQENQHKSIITKTANEVEQKNLQEQKQIIQETDELAAGILKATYEVQKHSEISALKDDLASLRSAINTLKTTAALSIQNQSLQKIQSLPEQGCGCSETKEKKCCIEIFGSGVRVIKAADGIVPTLELILAIQAGGIKAVFPGLTSQINVNQNVGWVKVDWSITKICVPCSQQMTIPLLVEAMDIDKVLSVPEKGANTGSITISCNCSPNSVIIDVNLSSGSILGGEKKGQIMVEVSARRVNGECCC
jgi:hypothetical protein